MADIRYNRGGRSAVLMISILVVLLLVCNAGCGVIGQKKTEPNYLYPTPAPLNLPVDEDTFWMFSYKLRAITDTMAAKRELTSSRPDYFQYQLPETLASDSDDPAVRYLAEKLDESKQLGYAFSSLLGKNVAGCVMVYANLGVAHVYIGLCDEAGEVTGLWEDDYNKPAQVGEDTLHWSVLGLVTKELKSTTVVGNE